MSHAGKVFAVGLLAALAWAVAPVAEAQPPIRIGASLPQTGAFAANGQNTLGPRSWRPTRRASRRRRGASAREQRREGFRRRCPHGAGVGGRAGRGGAATDPDGEIHHTRRGLKTSAPDC